MAYAYQPLDTTECEIRLLTIIEKPLSSEDSIRCRLHTVSLDKESAPEFYSVSYCWGNPEPRREITVDGHTVLVPYQTEQVLRHISECMGAVTLWIDAVCINQASIQERQEQIPLMRKIYSSTREGLVFLGPEDGTMQITLQHLFHLQDEMQKDVTSLVSGAGSNSASAGGAGTNIDINSAMFYQVSRESTAWPQPLSCGFNNELVRKFYTKAWFSRVWVVQEAILAPKSRCFYGAFEIDLDMVLAVAAWICIVRKHVPLEDCSVELTHRLRGAANMWYMRAFMTYDGSMDCMLPLGSCRDLLATDVRDKVFGQLATLCPT